MFTVDDELLSAFSGVIRKNKVKTAIVAFQQKYPNRSAYIGEEAVAQFIEKLFEKSEQYSLRSEREINGLTLLMYYGGASFDTDPQYPWARLKKYSDTPVGASPASSWAPFQKVYAQFVTLHNRISGDSNTLTIAALNRFCQLTFQQIAACNSDAAIIRELQTMYPEKFTACLTPLQSQQAFLHLARDKAMQQPMHQGFATYLFACLMLLFGAAVETDPLYAPLHAHLTGNLSAENKREMKALEHTQAFCRQRISELTTGL